LCLRGTTDYWINALDGRPFFLVSRPVEVLRTEIIPLLLTDAAGQPTAAALAEDPLRHRFTLVFDRAGYSPEFFAGQKAQRVAVITYHKFPGEDWPEAEFTPPATPPGQRRASHTLVGRARHVSEQRLAGA
jgi:hypothetical protein